MYISMKMEIVSEKFKYEKPQIEKVDLGLKDNLCQQVVTMSLNSVAGPRHDRFQVFDSATPTENETWGSYSNWPSGDNN